MNKIVLLFIFLFSLLALSAREFNDAINKQAGQTNRVNNDDVSFEFPHFIFSHTNTVITIKFKDPNHPKLTANNNKLNFIVNGDDQLVEFDKNGVGTVSCTFKGNNKLAVLFEDITYNMQMPVISIWYMILPLGGLLLFLIYKIIFSKQGLSISKKEITERKINSSEKSNLRVVSRKEEEEEILV